MAKIIKLTENQFVEMIGYHGSGADFDKFNHKKYLNSGAGSQSFGWGTYITNDRYVALGYTDTTKTDQAFLYEVEIPDDNGQNYLEYNAYMRPDEKKRILDKAKEIERRFNFKFNDGFYSYLNNGDDGSVSIGLNNEGATVNWMYYLLSKNLGSEKAASLFLMHCGFDGIKYPSGTMWKKISCWYKMEKTRKSLRKCLQLCYI